MDTPHDRSLGNIFVSIIFIGLLVSGSLPPASAQILPPINNPPPGSTLTTTTVTFNGDDAGQAGEQHWLSVETAPYAKDIFHQSLGTGHKATVSGLPTSGTLHVRYLTYTPATGWKTQFHTYTMNVDHSGGNTGGGGNNTDSGATGNHTLRWDRVVPGSERFVMKMQDEAILDTETGLVWQRTLGLSSGHQWNVARIFCPNTTIGGRKGWRLPSVQELGSLLIADDSLFSSTPKLPVGHPFIGVQAARYWSATLDAFSPTARAWSVSLSHGTVGSEQHSELGHVWCVRGGGPLTAY